MADKLSEASVHLFKRFEEDLCGQNVSSEEAQALMLAKYNELLLQDKSIVGIALPSVDKPLPSYQQPKRQNARRNDRLFQLPEIKPKKRTIRRPEPKSEKAARFIEERSRLHETYSSKSVKRRLTGTSSSSSSSDKLLLPHIPSADSTDHEDCCQQPLPLSLSAMSLSNDSMDITDMDMAEVETDDESASVCSTMTEQSEEVAEEVQGVQGLRKVLSMIPEAESRWGGDLRSFACKLCKKHFPSQALLDTHLSYSQLHRQNLLDLRSRYSHAYAAADRMDSMLKKTVDQFYSLLSLQRLRKQQMKVSTKSRWQAAAAMVMKQCSARRYAVLLEEMNEQQVEQTTHSSSSCHHPPPLLLSEEESKFFWRSKARFALRYYLHEHFNCVEVVPQLLPNRLDADGYQELRCQPTKRIYLDSRILLEAAALDPAAAPAPAPIPCTPEEVEGAVEEEDEAVGLKNRAIARMVCAHITSRLLMDHGSSSLYFDEMRYPTCSPVLPKPPSVHPVVLESERLYHRWEVCEKLDELSALQVALREAVAKAEHIAARIHALQPKTNVRTLPPLEHSGQLHANPMAMARRHGGLLLSPL